MCLMVNPDHKFHRWINPLGRNANSAPQVVEGALVRVRRAALIAALVRTLIRLGHRRCVTTR